MVNNRNHKKNRTFFTPLIISAVIYVILLYSHLLPVRKANCSVPYSDTRGKFNLTGTIISTPVKKSSGKFYLAKMLVHSFETENKITIICENNLQVLLPVESIEAYYPGKLYSKNRKNNAAVCDQNSELELSGHFISQDIFAAETLNNSYWKNNPAGKISRFRARSRINFKRIMYAWGSAGGLLMALLTGMKEYIDTGIAEKFRSAGLSHILALSGMHLNLFTGLAKKLKRFSIHPIVINLIQFTAILIFIWFAGLSPSLLRAALCSTILITCSILNLKNIRMLEILASSFLIHISIKPEEAYEMSFILSYGALAGILIFSEITSYLVIKKIPSVLSNSFSASFGAQGITAPVSLNMTGNFAFFGVFATIIVSPMITIFIYTGLFLILLCLIFPVLVPAGAFLMKILYTVTVKTVNYFAALPSLSLQGI